MHKQILMTYKLTTITFALLLAPAAAQAIPAFSRQINAGCSTCHFGGGYTLNEFGREFLMNSFHETKKMKQMLRKQEAARRARKALRAKQRQKAADKAD